MSSESLQRNSDPAGLRHRIPEDVNWIRGRVRRAADNYLAEFSLDFYRCLRAGVRAVTHSFKEWQKRSS